MSSVDVTSNIYSSLGLNKAETATSKDNSALQMQDFMNLLVTELTNQDPFKPMENSEMATQISQFATVSGIEELNTSFSGLATNLTSGQALQAAGLVGRQVQIPSNNAHLPTGGSISGSVYLPESSSDITLRVTNSQGELVREMKLGMHQAGEFSFNWDGADDAGEYLESDVYHVSLQANSGEKTIEPEMLINAEVNSVSLGAPGQPIALNLTGLGTISFNDVTAIH